MIRLQSTDCILPDDPLYSLKRPCEWTTKFWLKPPTQHLLSERGSSKRTRRVLFLALSLYAFLLCMGLIYLYCATLLPDNLCWLPQSQGVFTLLSLVAMDSLRIISCSLTDGRTTNMSFKRRHFFYTTVVAFDVDCRECRNTTQLSCSQKSIFYFAKFGFNISHPLACG